MEETEGCVESNYEINRISKNRSKDLLRQLSAEIYSSEKSANKLDDVELSLGLSLGGRFGVEPNRLVRSSSIGGTASFLMYEEASSGSIHRSNQSLARTVSLPVETDEERRRRKEMQSLRRLEAKRKRSEKQRSLSYRPAGMEEEKHGEEEDHSKVKKLEFLNGVLPCRGGGFGSSGWNGGVARGGDGDSSKSGFGGSSGLLGFASSSSIGSQGSTSSGVSDMAPGSAEERSPVSTRALPEHVEQKLPGSLTERPALQTGTDDQQNSSLKRNRVEEDGAIMDMSRSMMEDMPCVSTRGCGPNGKKVEGFLYKYRKGEEVRIVCVCHGSFLSPAEFVRHAGGGDVQHPLRHIVVNPSASLL